MSKEQNKNQIKNNKTTKQKKKLFFVI